MIEVYDDFFPEEIHHQIYTFLMDTGGWKLHGGCSTNRFWHFDDLEQIEYFNDFLYKEIITKLNKKFSKFNRIYANGQTAGQCGTSHTDDGDFTFLYYPCLEWKLEWEGHLVFPTDDRIIKYKPNRAVLFSGNQLHYANAPNRCYNDLRISLAYKLWV